jgi:hypothetical protein
MSSDDGTPVAPTREEIEAVSSASLVDFEYRQLKRRRDAADRLRREQLELEFSGTLTPAQEVKESRTRSSIMKRDELRNLPKPKPLIEGMLYLDSISWIAGESGSYKSFVALDLAAHYSSSRDMYHGLHVAQGKSLIVVGEGNSAYAARVEAWEQYNREDWPDDCDFHNGAIQLGDRDSVAALHNIIREDGYSLVIFDTQAMMTVGLSENDSQDMGIFVSSLHAMRQATGGCMLVVHHFGKSSADMRGSGAMYAAATTVVTTKRRGQQVTMSTRHGDNGKQKDGVETEYPPFVMQEIATSLVVTAPIPLTGERPEAEKPNIDLRQYTRSILTVLRDKELWGGTQAEIRSWLEEININPARSTLSTELQKMINEGLLAGPKTKVMATDLGREAIEGS